MNVFESDGDLAVVIIDSLLSLIIANGVPNKELELYFLERK